MSCPGYKYTLSCCMNMRNEGKFLKEWLDHYISEGVEHFYLIDNGSTDNTMDIIKKYDNITLFKDNRKYPNYQEAMLNENLLPVIKESKWLMIVDADELMKGQNNYTIKSYIETLPNNINCIYVIWKMFFNKTNDISKMTDIKSRFNYDNLNNDKITDCPHKYKNLIYFLMFGKSIFRSVNIDRVRVHKQLTPGEMINNFNIKLDIFPDTLFESCNYINETSIKKANIVLNHYFIKTEQEYDNRIKKTKEIGGWNCPGWDYLGFLITLYNLNNKYLLKEE